MKKRKVMRIDILSRINDEKIGALNVLAEILVKDYLRIAKHIIDDNEMQRKKVKSSKTVYSLLRNDLKQGCTIPPIFLAVRKEAIDENEDEYLQNITDDEIKESIRDKKLIILDGLQRTHQMLALEDELKKTGDKEALDKFHTRRLRVELYVGINKIGILYRMLTLNTGQTPMSIRHQIEILYQDYITDTKIEGVELLREVDGPKTIGVGRYKFSDVVDGFQSYLEKNELSFDRATLLDDIKSLEKLSKKGQKVELFQQFLKSFHKFMEKIEEISDGWEFSKSDYTDDFVQPFGRNIANFYLRPQVITAFGAIVGVLEENDVLSDFDELCDKLDDLVIGGDIYEVYYDFLSNLEHIRTTSKKIGNSQRRYFYHFFKSLLNINDESSLNVRKAVKKARQMYNVEFL
ncbi:hypothetical protein GM418_27360 [Maribellus comscasis]|uniref:DUF262 domain-containing protein n=1 Tax=Maribellus comscasis TaxID=2681766 RepID=A0A6I6K3U2_9BACT|nr:hypothetical protein [Maribellus comscasis]QGY47247.1 hypothetical protein GM418_27360 [Maribellus comscasis]